MALQIQYRRDTAANWTSANPVLLSGEVGYETDTKRIKVGDGTTAWSDLSYWVKTMPNGNLVGDTDTQTLTNKTINLTNNTLTATSAQIQDAVSDETGSGALVFGTSPSIASPTIDSPTITGNGTASFSSMTAPIGGGFKNMVVYTTGTGATWTLPNELQVTGGAFRVTLVGGGGSGGGTAATIGQCGGGGGSGGVVISYQTYVAGQNTMTYTVGAGGAKAAVTVAGNAGGASSIVYNGVTVTAGGGGGGPLAATTGPGTGGTATGGTLNIPGCPGGYGGTTAATTAIYNAGGDTPLGYGFGGRMHNGTASVAGVGYGSGGSGAHNAVATASAGAAGAGGLIIIEY